MRIAFIGYGKVGGALANRLQRVGHEVVLAVDEGRSTSAEKLIAQNPQIRQTATAVALASAELVFLAIPFPAVETILPELAPILAGKILVDCTNPVGPGLSHGLDSRRSGTQIIAELLPETRVVKAFSIYGYENFISAPQGEKPVMLYCGDDKAKTSVASLIDELGWQPLDVGGLEQALHLEHMTLLWVRMVRMNGFSPNLMWSLHQ